MTLSISEVCYRYECRFVDENQEIANLLVKLTADVERFDRAVRYDWLNQEIFYDGEEVQEKATRWL